MARLAVQTVMSLRSVPMHAAHGCVRERRVECRALGLLGDLRGRSVGALGGFGSGVEVSACRRGPWTSPSRRGAC